MRGHYNRIEIFYSWARVAITAFLIGLLFFNPASANKPKASLAPLQIETSIPKSDKALLSRIDVAKRLREALVDSGMFALYSRDSAELKGSIQREKSIAESGLAKNAGDTDYRYSLVSYFFSPKVTTFSAHSRFSPVPFTEGLYDRTDVGAISIALSVMGADGEILFEETSESKFRIKYEYESKVAPKGGRPQFSRLEKITDNAIHNIVNALDSRVNPITIYDRHGDTVLINRGKNNGFDTGDRLLVFSTPKEWTNPSTGQTRQMTGRQVGEVKISRIYEDSSEAKVLTDNGIEVNFVLKIK